MTDTKRRQGQRGATPKPICPKCGEYLKRATREAMKITSELMLELIGAVYLQLVIIS